jgi:hypothetical protein
MTKATHNGHCQVCGRQQAVRDGGRLAKHGYTTKWGFFSGTCSGSDIEPLEVSRSKLDETVRELELEAAILREMKAEDVTSVAIESRKGYGEPVIHVFTTEADLLAYVEANPLYRSYNWENMRKARVVELRSRAASMIKHAEMLVALAAEVHGGELIPRETKPELERVAKYPKDMREAWKIAAELKAEGWNTRVSRLVPKVTATRAAR